MNSAGNLQKVDYTNLFNGTDLALAPPDSRMITFLCLSCGGILKVDTTLAGRIGQCSHCGHWMQVPGFSATEMLPTGKRTASLVLLSSLVAVLLLGVGGLAGFRLGRMANPPWELPPDPVRSVVPKEPPPVVTADWQQVSQTARQGDVAVALQGAELRYVAVLRQYVMPKDTPNEPPTIEEKEDLWKHKELVLSIRIHNHGTQTFHYTHPDREGTKLIDNHGNLFRQTYENGTRVGGQLAQTEIAPGQAVEDLLVFSCSYVGKGEQLLLELPAQLFGGESQGKIKLKMDQKLIGK
jgi:hypothetical protein